MRMKKVRKHRETFLSIYGGLLAVGVGVLVLYFLDRCG